MQNAIPKISIIVCGYNEEKLLPRCVSSLLAQTLQEIEIILVDDASTDNTLKLMREYETQYPEKVRLIHNETNLLLGGSRNRALEAARGEYLGFVDCDDWVEAEMYESLYNEAKKNNSDASWCLRQQITESGKITPDDASYCFPVGNITEQIRKQMIAQHSTFLQKFIFKRAVFIDNNIRFPAHLRYEDVPVAATMLPYLNNISTINKPFYNYFIRSNSITTTRNDTKFRDKIAVCQLIIDEYKKRGFYQTYKNEVNYLFFRKGYIHAALNYIVNAQKPRKEVILELKKAILAVDKNYRRNPYYKQRKSFIAVDVILSNMLLINILKFILSITKYNI